MRAAARVARSLCMSASVRHEGSAKGAERPLRCPLVEGSGLAAAANAFFEREELWIPRCHRAAKLVDLRCWRMDLEPDDLCDLQRLAKQFSNVLTMCE